MKEKSISLNQFILNIRWIIGIFGPLILLLSQKPIDSVFIVLIIIYNSLNVLCQIAFIKNIDINKYLPAIFIFDLIMTSVLVYIRGGFRSDTFQVYYIFILMSAIIYNIRRTLFICILSATLYTSIGILQVGNDFSVDILIHRALDRSFYFILIGLLTSYLSTLSRKQQETILHLESEKSQLQLAAEESRKLASLDGLTHIYNHRYFQEKLVEYTKHAKENNYNLSLLMIDIDNFKIFNDTYGHRKGDFILKELSKIFCKMVKNEDIVARYGGEEFSIILNQCDRNLAKDIAERIRKTVEKHSFAGLNVTISIGVSSLTKNCSTPENLIDVADKALYKAKENRNKTFVA